MPLARLSRFVALAGLLLSLGDTAFGYGPIGHQLVGAIADERLAGKPAGKQISELLDGLTLERVSTYADEIKGWDKKGVDDPKSFRYTAHPKMDEQLAAFWRANQPTHDVNSPNPSHHWFHYTDVPVDHAEKYGDGKAGRSKWDVVHMIAYCVDVLQGRIPEENDRKITKLVAVILLAHYVGDIHQPLHVGALYFDEGKTVDPGKDAKALADEGGNTVNLRLTDDPPTGRLPHTKSLHGFWDTDTVMTQLPQAPEEVKGNERFAFVDPAKKEMAHKMATEEPKNWRPPAQTSPRDYGELWANDILPIAREAHERLTFVNMSPLVQEDRTVAQGEADENAVQDKARYKDWAVNVVRDEIHKAGWRLADLLEKCFSAKAPVGRDSVEPTSSPAAGEKSN